MTTARDWAALLGRILLAVLFVDAGFGKITGFEGAVGHIRSAGWPMPEAMAVGAIVVELVGGLMLAAGYKARWVALALAAFTLVASFGFHAFWDLPAAQQRMQYIHFWKNMSIAGGMLMVFSTLMEAVWAALTPWSLRYPDVVGVLFILGAAAMQWMRRIHPPSRTQSP